MIRLWESGVSSEVVDDALSSKVIVEEREEEMPLPPPQTADDRHPTVHQGPLLTALLNKMETLLDQVVGGALALVCMLCEQSACLSTAL